MYKTKPVATTPVVTLDALNDKTTIYINDIKNRTQQDYVALIEDLMVKHNKTVTDMEIFVDSNSTTVDDLFTKYVNQRKSLEDLYIHEIYSVIFDFTDQTTISDAYKTQIAMHHVYEKLRGYIIGP